MDDPLLGLAGTDSGEQVEALPQTKRMKVRKTNKAGRVTVELGDADEALLTQGAAQDSGRFRLKTLLVPVDFSACSDKAVEYARAFGEQFGAELILLHVVEPVVYPETYAPASDGGDALHRELLGSAENRLARQAGLLRGSGLRVRTRARVGRPFMEISEFAREAGVDLILLGTHGYTGLKHVLLGSTAERVVRHAPCPVLTVRADEHEFIAPPSEPTA